MPPTTAAPPRRAAVTVTALCWVIVVFDGYDLIVYGTALPQLFTEPGWGLTPSAAGLLGSLAFAGMLVGAVLAGTLADRLGRRRVVLLCSLWFSVCTGLCAVAPGPEVFGALRFLAGLGLGGLVPSASALTAEFVSPRHRSLVSTLMMSGVPVGGCVAALVGIPVLPTAGWRPMFALGLLALLVVPVALRWLPESPAAPRPATVSRPLRTLTRPPYRRPTALFVLATTMTLFTWYGLATWLPQLMRQSGVNLGSALTYLLALSLGAVAGSLVTAWAGTRFGPVPTGIGASLAAALGLLLLLTGPGPALAYGALVLAGIGTHGTQCLVIAAVASHYPAHLRGSALGFALGFGRVGAVLAPQTGGWLLAAGLGTNANFTTFAAAAAACAVLLALVPREGARTP
ncbi:AAHS family benzoate transporter-like MFS transporter [Crossiella equi]|uniref:AAHS family benzoate transporter-like MFS transporter n=1 Tax=Crossiella equi TaxID=130796 RepID=A0ABS5A995_9PSEU|nr:aromatic acid/H+ symport family MFS transporter [Crossiella equi]MBP2472300.1 AAHS family benzoate transporter-like MFS transporter [Crossiella equi]